MLLVKVMSPYALVFGCGCKEALKYTSRIHAASKNLMLEHDVK